MVNGRPGDDLILDVTVHGVGVYTDQIDDLIREVWPQCGTDEQAELRALLPDPEHVEASELEEVQLHLEAMRSRLLGEARGRGWEGPPEPAEAQLEETDEDAPEV
jgi:hypothetical protein